MILKITPRKQHFYADGEEMTRSDSLLYETLGLGAGVIALILAVSIFWMVAVEGTGMAIAIGVILVVALVTPTVTAYLGDSLDAYQAKRKAQRQLDIANGVK